MFRHHQRVSVLQMEKTEHLTDVKLSSLPPTISDIQIIYENEFQQKSYELYTSCTYLQLWYVTRACSDLYMRSSGVLMVASKRLYTTERFCQLDVILHNN